MDRRAHVIVFAIATSASLATLSSFSACSIYDSSLLVPAAPLDASFDAEASSDSAVIDAGTDSGCNHVVPPGPPAQDDPDAGPDVDFVLAMSYVRVVPHGTATVNHPQAPQPFDLDNTCTCPGPPSCQSPGATICDGDGGTDDSTGNLFATFAELAPSQFSDDDLNYGERLGDNTTLLRVQNYNGLANDTKVTVSAYLSNGTNGVQNGPATAPKYDGTDVWTITPDSLLGGDTFDGGATCENNPTCVPVVFDLNAYVVNGTLVAHLDARFALGDVSSHLLLQVSAGELVAPLVFDGTSYRIDEGLYAGRVNSTELLTGLQSVQDPLNPSEYLCGASGTYANIRTSACQIADIMTNPSQDDTGAACDALSLGTSFAAVAAHFGPLYARAPLNPCGASWVGTCADTTSDAGNDVNGDGGSD